MPSPNRHVIVDGSNIATEGRSLPSLQQLDEAVQAFQSDHPDASVTVVVDATFAHRIATKERKAFDAAVDAGEIIVPPAGAVGRGDAFILQVAAKGDAEILSNDSFQEFHGEHEWLFDEGRLIGAKPVDGIGWVFVDRVPVRGPESRRATRTSSRSSSRSSKKATKRSSGSRSKSGSGSTSRSGSKSDSRSTSKTSDTTTESKPKKSSRSRSRSRKSSGDGGSKSAERQTERRSEERRSTGDVVPVLGFVRQDQGTQQPVGVSRFRDQTLDRRRRTRHRRTLLLPRLLPAGCRRPVLSARQSDGRPAAVEGQRPCFDRR